MTAICVFVSLMFSMPIQQSDQPTRNQTAANINTLKNAELETLMEEIIKHYTAGRFDSAARIAEHWLNQDPGCLVAENVLEMCKMAKAMALAAKHDLGKNMKGGPRRLDEVCDVDIRDKTFLEVVNDLRALCSIPIKLDDRALKEANVDLHTKLSGPEKAIPLGSVIDHFLRKMDLVCVTQKDCLLITIKAYGKSGSIRRTYPVADLVVPIPYNWDGPESHDPKATKEDQLLDLITKSICPESWAPSGGPNTIQYFSQGMGLVISAPKDIQEQVAGLLAALLRLQDNQVTVQMRVFSVSPGFLTEMARKLTGAKKDGYIVLNAEDVVQVLQQAERNSACSTIAMPRVTMFNGQRATLNTLTERMECVEVKKIPAQDGFDIVESYRQLKEGMEFRILPVVSADRKQIRTHLTGAFYWTQPKSTTTDNRAKRIVQQKTETFERHFSVSEAQSVLIVGGKVRLQTPLTIERTAWNLFGNERPVVTDRVLLVLVTPQRIEEVETQPQRPEPTTEATHDLPVMRPVFQAVPQPVGQ